ncbi:MAG: PQQ-binding-like beta-propeller repeat protein [Pirellulaceae bacterium]|nr:PQQ-binding-like beta-propeller repeat protein [Pirellulaceae bacterium]
MRCKPKRKSQVAVTRLWVLLLLATFMAGLVGGPAAAQQSRYASTLISAEAAQTYGLRRAWYTHAEIDRARGRLGSITPHISSVDGHTVFEVTYNGGSLEFSERQLDPFGRPWGVDGARKLADAKLEELKAAKLDPKLVTHVVPKITLYVVSDRAMVQALDGESGRSRWMLRVGKRDYPTLEVGANDRYVGIVNGSTLYVLDANTGELAWQRDVVNVPGAGPALSDELVFVPMVNGAVEAYYLNDPRRAPYIFASHGRALIQPTVSAASVAWPTDVGHVYVGRANERGIRYRLEAKRTIVSRVSHLAPTSLFVTSIDGFVYCIQEISGNITWRYSTGEPISQSAIPIGDSVYVITDTQWLYALDAATGQQKWSSPRVAGFVSASTDRVYVVGVTGGLDILDAASGGRLGTLPGVIDDMKVANQLTDRIYLTTPTGIIQCLHEERQRFPLLHAAAAEAATQKPEVKQQGLEQQPAAAPQQPQDPFGGGAKDPFGGGGNDPFGGGANKDPFGGGAGGGQPAQDPFGGGGNANPFD